MRGMRSKTAGVPELLHLPRNDGTIWGRWLQAHDRFAAFLRVLDLRRAVVRGAPAFLAAEPVSFAGVRLLSLMLFCSSDMKSTTLVDAFFGIATSSAEGARTPPLALMRASITLVRRSRKSSWYSSGFHSPIIDFTSVSAMSSSFWLTRYAEIFLSGNAYSSSDTISCG